MDHILHVLHNITPPPTLFLAIATSDQLSPGGTGGGEQESGVNNPMLLD